MIAYLNNKKLRKIDVHSIVTSTPEVEIETIVVTKTVGLPTLEEMQAEYDSPNNYMWSNENYLIAPTKQFITSYPYQNTYYDGSSWQPAKTLNGDDYYTYTLNNVEEARNCLLYSGNSYQMLCETSDVTSGEYGKYGVDEVKNYNLNTVEETDISGNTNSIIYDSNHDYHIYYKDEWDNEELKDFYNPYTYESYSTFYAVIKEDKRYLRRKDYIDYRWMDNVDREQVEYANINFTGHGDEGVIGDVTVINDNTIMFSKNKYYYENGRINVKKGCNVFYNNKYYPNLVYKPSSYKYGVKEYLYVCPFGKSFTEITLQQPDETLTTARQMFDGCESMRKINGLSQLDTSQVKDMQAMFRGCGSLTSLDIKNWNTSNVTDMQETFSNCNDLTSIDISNWDTSNVTTMYSMFYNCKKLQHLNLGNFDTTNVTNISMAFWSDALQQIIWNNMANGKNVKTLQFQSSWNLGKGYEEDLKNTFVHNSFDRASSGFPTCTLSFTQSTKELFSDEDIATMSLKGFTIA